MAVLSAANSVSICWRTVACMCETSGKLTACSPRPGGGSTTGEDAEPFGMLEDELHATMKLTHTATATERARRRSLAVMASVLRPV
jgi:hypothetical protein